MKKLVNVIARIILSVLVFIIVGALCFTIFSKIRLSMNLEEKIVPCPSCPDGVFECLCYSTDLVSIKDKRLSAFYKVLEILIPIGAVALLNKFILRKK